MLADQLIAPEHGSFKRMQTWILRENIQCRIDAGFESGIKTMSKGGQRRIVVPPELGPPTGPATFFSAKQCEVFDVELLDIRTCKRRQVAFFSDVVCE